MTLDAAKAAEDREFLEAMATDLGVDDNTRSRASLILRMSGGEDLKTAAERVGISVGTARDKVKQFNSGGWKSLLTVMAPRGGDFLARYDQGYWAERLVRNYLDQSMTHRAVPYGTSRSEPFTDMHSFRQYIEAEFQLQAWSAGGRWKRPDLLMIPREVLREEKGNDTWTPDLKHLDNEHCSRYVEKADAAIEVETSLWQVKKATVRLSYTVKVEDLEALRNWVRANKKPLFIVQVFYDCAYALPFATLEEVISLSPTDPRHVSAKIDNVTKKETYKIPLNEGILLGSIAEPDVEGKVFKAPNGKVTVYGRLTGSAIEVSSRDALERLAKGILSGGRGEQDTTDLAALPAAEGGREYESESD
ncbi:MAG: AccI family restriction endonuclease [Acidobacteriota bacterium]|nr:AccI family restriction endonuclease [Acidobacteriota bacterium]